MTDELSKAYWSGLILMLICLCWTRALLLRRMISKLNLVLLYSNTPSIFKKVSWQKQFKYFMIIQSISTKNLIPLPLGCCFSKNGNHKLLTTIPIPLELTTLKLACAEIINMDFWWLCYYGWEGGKESGGLVAVRPGRFFLMWARALSFHTARFCALQRRRRRRSFPNENTRVYTYSTHRETEKWLTK